ncbi:SusC/RagA family TonB-linked outer membrane protein [Chitinophaga sp. S165]|uniref:SusC/RagA family TonB-linked outer membrane protein n=1 Tax=Chitinophaga sp. S165 TaxID=2135462 RepID=UPI000D9ECAAC|nr:SusC/RagA family TonB-linked outer membrane protein [Chitinophaga sp. S165]PWV44638.1 TonB-linked SusC/RagA family outer membrane protein [Chitinophaga sp. S165]
MLQQLSHKGNWYLLATLLLFALHSSVTAQSSNNDPGTRTVSISGSNVTLQSVLKNIEKQTGMRFNYGGELDTRQRVSLKQEKRTLAQLLSELFSKTGFSWRFMDNNIFLIKNSANSRGSINGQNPAADSTIRVSGIITSESGQALEGVSVGVIGTVYGTTSGKDGRFFLSNVNREGTLLVSSIGYEMQRVPVNGRSQLAIKLIASENKLEAVEVLSTGYQNIPRERATGSFAQIDNELYNRSIGPNVLDRITDVTSGLVYQPGKVSAFNNGITIRGVSTINANRTPLIVVDNFPFDGDINNINPNDIQSVTVLKDAAAASIWGVRAGNGVIVITTKRGRYNQQNTVQFNSNVTIGEKPDINSLPLMKSTDVIEVQKYLYDNLYYDLNDWLFPLIGLYPTIPKVAEILIAKKHGTISDAEAEAQINQLRNNNVLDDINKHLLRNSIQQQYALNMSGGTPTFSYYGSLGYDRFRGNEVGKSSDRITVRLENSYKPTNRIELNGFVSYVQTENKNNSIDYSGFIPNGRTFASPYTKFQNPDGSSANVPYILGLRDAYVDTASYPGLLDWHYRVLDELHNANNKNTQFDTRIGAGLKYNILKGLNLEVKYQYQKALSKSRNLHDQNTFFTRDLINKYMNVSGATTVYPVPLGAILESLDGELTSWNARAQASYNQSWNNHDIVMIAGTEIRQTTNDFIQSRKYGYDLNTLIAKPVDYANQYIIRPSGSTASVPFLDFSTGTISRYRSFYGNAAYTYNQKYTLSGSARVDGSNFYGVDANQRVVPLWSIGASWDISKEFFYRLEWLPYLRLRTTIGYNGNTNNSASAYATTTQSIYFLTGLTYGSLNGLPNSELRWEKVRVANFGLDFGTRNSRISGSIEYYVKNSIDLISAARIDPTYGDMKFTGNNASMKIKGVDLTLASRNLVGKITWTTNFLLSFNKDRVTEYNLNSTSIFDYFQDNVPPTVEKPLNSIWGFQWAGLDPQNGDARIYADSKVINSANFGSAQVKDLQYIGTSLPKYFGSIRNTFGWRALAVSFNITFRAGHYFRRPSINYDQLFVNSGGHSDYSNRWQKTGDELTTNVPALPLTTNSYNVSYVYGNSTILVEKADHIRFQDLRISYDLGNVLNQQRIKRLQLYFYVNNLGIIWRKNKYNLDPEYVNIPSVPRTASLGVNLTL